MEVLDRSFDAQLVAVFNGPIGFEHGNGLSFCLHDGQVIPLNVTLAALRNLNRNRNDIRRRPLADTMFDTALDSDQVPKPAREALKDGAVQLSCFLSSPGGSAQYVDDFKLTCAAILSRNGAVSAYGFE